MILSSLEGLTLHVADVERSLRFYAQIPGAVLLVHRPSQFALFEIGGGLLGLLQWRTTGFHLEVGVSDLNGLYAQLRAAGIEPAGPPRRRPWGERTFEVEDPDGNRIEFQDG